MSLTTIQNQIHEIRGQKVMFDFDLASLYEVENRALKQAVKRNLDRFPEDFMFQLTKSEWQEVITICDNLLPGVQYSPALPFAFTEQGVSMLSSVLKSKKAMQINIEIMRTFVMLRKHLLVNKELAAKLIELESQCKKQFGDIYEAINYLLKKEKTAQHQKERKRIGFKN